MLWSFLQLPSLEQVVPDEEEESPELVLEEESLPEEDDEPDEESDEEPEDEESEPDELEEPEELEPSPPGGERLVK